jgi:hypothetical protein
MPSMMWWMSNNKINVRRLSGKDVKWVEMSRVHADQEKNTSSATEKYRKLFLRNA